MTQALPGFKTFIVGDSGNGKTHVVRTLLGTGIQPLVLATEPGMRALAPCDNPACLICKDTRSAPPIPWAYVSPQPGNITTLLEQAKLINTRDLKFLCNINDTARSGTYTQYLDVLKLVENFVDNTGRAWGNVSTWNTDRCLVLDGLSSINVMAMDMFVGKRPAYDKSDYQIGQRAILSLITLLTCQTRCHFVLIAHPERGQDEVGMSKITANALGKALAPDLPRLFDDMPAADRSGDKFTWDTAAPGRVSKGRNLPIKSGLLPDFRQIVDSWKRAGGKIEPTTQQESKP